MITARIRSRRRRAKANGKVHKGNGHAAEVVNGRDARGLFVKGAPPGPGRPPKSVNEHLLDVMRQFAAPLEAARDAVQIARELSPAMMLRAYEVAHDPNAENKDVLEAVRLVVERAHGLPSQAVATLNFDAKSMSPEQKEQVHTRAAEALERLRGRLAPPQTIEGEASHD